ncbi:LexA family transcriptional regulator [Chelatococcus reniformis]|nr:XRE family transcriptional regulator [Chelatococcus reniformis]
MDADDKRRAEQGKRLADERRAAGYRSAREAALKHGWPESTYRAHEKGTRTIGQDDAERYGRAFSPPRGRQIARQILFGTTIEQLADDLPEEVPVVGKIGAGGSIETSDEQLIDPLYVIKTPFAVPRDAIAFEVVGESMWPRYDAGDVIICYRHSIDPEAMVGWEAAVMTSDGNRYLKRVLRTPEPGRYDLESHNAPPMRAMRLSWVSAVSAVVRASEVHRRKAPVRLKRSA